MMPKCARTTLTLQETATEPGGNLDSTTAAVSRLRTALEGSQARWTPKTGQ